MITSLVESRRIARVALQVVGVTCHHRWGRFKLIYIITVHFASPRWIDVQRRYLDRHVSTPFEVWTSLQDIDPEYGSRFTRVLDQKGRFNHANKLNHLAAEVCDVADPEDTLVFLDGDAFPIVDLVPRLDEMLGRAPLAAVMRAENLGDRQPHPCFCATTVETWLRIRGDWGAAATWAVADARYASKTPSDSREGTVTDVGGNLLRRLEVTDTEWLPLLRSNGHDLHPMFFGIYGDLVYHHGAGFRGGENRVDRTLAHVEPVRLPSVRLSRYVTERWYQRRLGARIRRNAEISLALFARIESGDTTWVDELRGAPSSQAS